MVTSSHPPEEWPRVFERHLNALDLNAIVMLYEPEVHFVILGESRQPIANS